MSAKKYILIVDDSSIVRAAVRGLFKPLVEFVVAGEAKNGREAIDIAERVRPDLIILDLSMLVMNGLQAAAPLLKMLPDVRILLFTSHDGPEVQRQAQMAGIHAVVSKSQAAATLIPQAQALLAEG
jgi:two-component system, NarL family, nitrate/nitrite response regulator NarL